MADDRDDSTGGPSTRTLSEADSRRLVADAGVVAAYDPVKNFVSNITVVKYVYSNFKKLYGSSFSIQAFEKTTF